MNNHKSHLKTLQNLACSTLTLTLTSFVPSLHSADGLMAGDAAVRALVALDIAKVT
jgi:hypothetical protein